MAGKISARQVLTPSGWMANGVVHWDAQGAITEVSRDGFDAGEAVGTLIPGVANLHTHSFQRAMAGLAETRGPGGSDDFWSWRQVMYRFLEILTPDHIEAIAAQVQMDMAEAGFTACAEFHYLHHQPGGTPYDDPSELSQCIFAASETSGLGLTHLPVLYSYGGLQKQDLGEAQARFGCSASAFASLFERIASAASRMPGDFRLGVAPHSLRAVDMEGLKTCITLRPEGPIHIHSAEQVREVDEVEAHLGARPVRWLLDNCPVDQRWCLIHATHMDSSEVSDLAASGAVAGLCPTTEANLGDGIFPALDFFTHGGRFGVGSDSNIRISLAEELRMLELSQRLYLRQRAVLTDELNRSTGRNLLEQASTGGAQAIGRRAGRIEEGFLADLVALRDDEPFLDWKDPDQRLDAWIFGTEAPVVSEVWSAGRHIVRGGEHVARNDIRARFAQTMNALRDRL